MVTHCVRMCKRGITVMSFGANGDSRELKTMLHSAHLCHIEAIPSALKVNELQVPKNDFLGLQLEIYMELHMYKILYILLLN